MKDVGKKKQPVCILRLDRFAFTGIVRSEKLPEAIGTFKTLRDFQPQPQGKIPTYKRLRTFLSTSNSARLCLQYKPILPWLPPWRFTLTAHDENGLSPDEIESAIIQCLSHRPTLVELAFDFLDQSVVNREFVLRHGKFGKSKRRGGRGGSGNLRYGGRHSPKLIRAYFKPQLQCFRVELEIHSGLLRKLGFSSAFELARLPAQLFPAHIQFVGFRWQKLERYLIKKFGVHDGKQVLTEARERAQSSLEQVTYFLSQRWCA